MPMQLWAALAWAGVWGQLLSLLCRSISAAYEMVKLDYKNVKILKGGLSDWIRQERPLEE